MDSATKANPFGTLKGTGNAFKEGFSKLGDVSKLTDGLKEVTLKTGDVFKEGFSSMTQTTKQISTATVSAVKQTVPSSDRSSFAPPPKFDLVAYCRDYLNRILTATPGMKVLLLDAETTRIVSLVYSQTEVLAQDVFLVDRIDPKTAGPRDPLPHLKAVCWVRPTPENIALLRRELKQPCYGSYNLYFTNIVKDGWLREMAESDKSVVVQHVSEMYCDYESIDREHYLIRVGGGSGASGGGGAGPKREALGGSLGGELALTNAPSNDAASSSVPSSSSSYVMVWGNGSGANRICVTPSSWGVRAWEEASERIVEGLGGLLLCIKRRPIIRYQRGSEMTKRVAEDLHRLTHDAESSLYDFGARAADNPPLVLILDRRDDPVTPLLSQWTYQAMLHELIGIRDNKVNLKGRERVHESNQEVVLGAWDAFFEKNKMANYGEIGLAIKELVDDFQLNHAKNTPGGIQTLDDMTQFLESYPEFRAKQSYVSKHVTLLGEMSHEVDTRMLMTVSEVEQDLASSTGVVAPVQQHYEAVVSLISNASVKELDRLRVVLLFALRYEEHEMGGRMIRDLMDRLEGRDVGGGSGGGGGGGGGALSALGSALGPLGGSLGGGGGSDAPPPPPPAPKPTPLSRDKVQLVTTLLRWAGAARRAGDLFGTRDVLNKAAKMFKGLKGVENVYTQHTPLLAQTLEQASRGKLKESDYPYVVSPNGGSGSNLSGMGGGGMGGGMGGTPSSSSLVSLTPAGGGKMNVRDVVVFVVGGTTYAEARTIAQLNQQAMRGEGWMGGMRFLLGGTSVLNSKMFLEDLLKMQEEEKERAR